MFKKIKKIASSYHLLPDKKRYAEFITALLSIPVLITVLLTNLNSLNSKDTNNSNPPANQNIIISYVPQKDSSEALQPTISENCKKGIGNVEILSPNDGATLSSNPVTIRIASDEDYCTVVWSYRINDGAWSEYDSNSVSLYNLKNGSTRFELKVKSTTNKEEITLTRRFTYTGGEEPTPTITPSPTPSNE